MEVRSIRQSVVYIFLVLVLMIAGCSSTLPYDDDDVAAIVRGEKITIWDLRFLYPDDRVLDQIESSIKATLVVQEAKNMNVDVTEDIEQTLLGMGSYPEEDDDTTMAESIREFAEPQANKLGMDPKEYYEQYIEVTTETVAYMNKYVQELLGEPDLDGEDIEEYNELANKMIDELVTLHADDIEIFIKP